MNYSIYKVGSSTVSYISNPHDIDLVAFNFDREKEDINILLDLYNNKNTNTFILQAYKSEIYATAIYNYGLSYFKKCIEGPDIAVEPTEWADKDWVKKQLSKCIPHQSSKKIYRFLLSCYRLEDKLSNLSQKEKEWIQLCHDKSCPDECYKYILTVLKGGFKKT